MSKSTVETPAPAISELEQRRQLVRSIMGGSATMRKPEYLPRYPAEDMPDYKARVDRTFLDNFVSMAVEKATGKIFAKEIHVDGLPTETEKLIDNIDRQGCALNPFMLDVARSAFVDGISYVMADMPRTDNVVTLADEKAAGVRPYAIHVKACCVLEVLSEMVDGIDTLTRVRIKEEICVPVSGSWDYTEIEQVRVWIREPSGLIRWELWREIEDSRDEDKFVLVDEGATTFKEIYLVPYYTNRTGFMLGAPPFQNIAESNLEHFQLKSDYQAALEMCNFSMYFATGVQAVDGGAYVVKVGPRQSLSSPQPEAKFGVLETTGVGVGLTLAAIAAVEARIECAGVNLRVENAGNVTATAAAIDSEDTNCALKAIAKGFGDSTERLFEIFAEMQGLDKADAGEACFNDDFGTAKGTPQGLTSLDKARALGDISREAYLRELVRRGELSEDFDCMADAELLASEAPDMSAIMTVQKSGVVV